MTDEQRLEKLTELNLRNRVERGRPKSGCGTDPCRPVCGLGYLDIPGPPSMIAQKGNHRYKHGTIHDQCSGCFAKEQNQTAIRQLKAELGVK
jgi:hypothetical protein